MCSLTRFNCRNAILNCLHGIGHGAFGAGHLGVGHKAAGGSTSSTAAPSPRTQARIETTALWSGVPSDPEGTEAAHAAAKTASTTGVKLVTAEDVIEFIAVVDAAAEDMMEERAAGYPGLEICDASPSRELGYFCAMGYYHQVGSGAMPFLPVLCHPTPRQTTPCLPMPHAMPRHTMPYHATPCHPTSYDATPYDPMPCHPMPYHVIPCHPSPFHPIPCHITPYYAKLA